MNTIRTCHSFSTTAVFVALAIGVCAGCSAKKSQTAENAVPETRHVNVQAAAIQKAKDLKVGYDNPKMGECPVCARAVDYESFVMIGRKKYALCSDDCGEKLRNDPERYLSTAKP